MLVLVAVMLCREEASVGLEDASACRENPVLCLEAHVEFQSSMGGFQTTTAGLQRSVRGFQRSVTLFRQAMALAPTAKGVCRGKRGHRSRRLRAHARPQLDGRRDRKPARSHVVRRVGLRYTSAR